MRRSVILGLASISLVSLTAPALAQDGATVLRVDKLEREMKAVQRKVFGTAAVVEPDMGVQTPTTPSNDGSSAPVADLTVRVDAIEAQLARLTGQVEQNSFKLRQIENEMATLKANAGAASVSPQQPATSSPPTTSTPSTSTPAPAVTPTRPSTPAASTTTAGQPSAARLAKVKAVEVPATGNAAEDTYNYGFRLWSAGLYPESQAQLEKLTKTYPNYSRMSFAQNLLGRAYMDDQQYENAVHTLYGNYKNNPKGERAADSLLYLGMTFAKMKNKQASCTAFTELFKVYGESMSNSLKTQATSERGKAGCA